MAGFSVINLGPPLKFIDVGDPLPGDTELESQFDVSRWVLREAMKTLSAKGLVVAKSRVGTRVTDRCHWNLIDEDVLRWHFKAGVTREFIDHLYDVRLVFEPASAAYAALRATPEDCAELRRYANLLGSEDLDWQSQVEADLRFHVLLTLVGANPFLESMIGFLKAASSSALQVRPSASMLSRLTVASTLAACAPPITETRALGHVKRNRGE